MEIVKKSEFEHIQHAHCETGVTVNLLNHYGIQISEPMIFGLGAGLYFIHLPFYHVNGNPAVAYRHWFVSIFRKSIKRLGGKIKLKTFSNDEKGIAFLDDLIDAGKPVAVVTNIYYLDYLPEYFRFQFSGHNLIVYGKHQDQYQISDPIIETASTIDSTQLSKARFAHAKPKPKGKLYYIDKIPVLPDLEQPIWESIEEVCYNMIVPPFPWIGCNGIKLLAKNIKNYEKKYSKSTINSYLSNIIQMQEVIGTGGGGFRFMYAAFLQEAGNLLDNKQLITMSERLTKIGDDWRYFASSAAKILKDRNTNEDRFNALGNELHEIYEKEKNFFEELRKVRGISKKQDRK